MGASPYLTHTTLLSALSSHDPINITLLLRSQQKFTVINHLFPVHCREAEELLQETLAPEQLTRHSYQKPVDFLIAGV